jgi:PTS system mannose-specific IIA component
MAAEEAQAFGLLVVSHGNFAKELVGAAETVVGKVAGLEALSIGWDDDVDVATRSIEEAVRRLDQGNGVLLLTDMFGGTPTNLALSMLDAGTIEIVTGVNLPMLIKFANLRGEEHLVDVAATIAREGRDAIQVASAILHPESADLGDESDVAGKGDAGKGNVNKDTVNDKGAA